MDCELQKMIESVESDFQKVEEKRAWNLFFLNIRNELHKESYDITEAKKPQNKKLNRYQDVNPYDHSRIVLKSGPCDYINASLVEVPKAERRYVLAQGPLPHTTPQFWLMIWEQHCRAIIMLNRIIEKNMIKCHQYWPRSNEDSFVFNEVGLKVTNTHEEQASYYNITKLKLENLVTNEIREVIHFHYTTWPDFGCPQSPTAFLRFLYLVRSSGTLDNSSQPAVVHCSAGIGRSGTFCLVDSCLLMMKELHLDNVVVRDVLMEMRRYRMGLVQTADQLRFSYLAILEGLKNEATTNGNLVEEENVGDEDEPPPLPPPRGESLRGRPSSNNHQHSRPEDGEGLQHRRKEREERQEKLENKVKELKQNMEKNEYWQGLRKSYIRPLGFGALLVGSGLLFYTWFYSRR